VVGAGFIVGSSGMADRVIWVQTGTMPSFHFTGTNSGPIRDR
jgi:hypothetical protein